MSAFWLAHKPTISKLMLDGEEDCTGHSILSADRLISTLDIMMLGLSSDDFVRRKIVS